MSIGTTEVYLIKAPLEKDYEHTIAFTTLSAQEQWFKSKSFAHITGMTYQRKDKKIRVNYQYDLIAHCNYVMYKNPDLTSKWYYAFITKMEYVDDGRTDVYIETDVMQTWLKDYTVKESFVEREHVDDDTIGKHTVPENLETGEYVCNKHNFTGLGYEELKIVIGVTETPSGTKNVGGMYHGVYSGLKYYGFPHTIAGAGVLKNFLSEYDSEALGEAVQCMFLIPKELCKNAITSDGGTSADLIHEFYPYALKINYQENESDNTKTIAFNTTKLDSYTPVNKKLLTFPFKYLLVSNNNGGDVIYHYEKFKDENGVIVDPRFRVDGVLCPGCSIRMVPRDYNGIVRNDGEGINLGKYPALNWTSDVFTNWLTQNAVNIGFDISTGIAQIGLAPVTGGLSAITGVAQIANTIGSVYQHSLMPPQSKGNINNGDVISATGKNDFHFYDMSIKQEYAIIIDRYFSMYGYKVNTLKVPNTFRRSDYWYTKCLNVNLDGNVPQDDLQKIKDCYNNGITFWRNGDNVGKYFDSNGNLLKNSITT